MNINQKLDLIKQVGEETVGIDEIKEKLEKLEKGEIKEIRAYDGFEPSGQIHIAQGLLRAIQVNKLTSCGITFVFWVADYFAWLNNKFGGDLEKIQNCGKYLIEVWKSCGMNLENVEFKWTSKELENNPKYWENFLKLSTIPSITRVLRCGQIMGRAESTDNPSSQIVYPLMQANDIKYLRADICQLGVDQRKVNMLARDVFPKLGWEKPAVVSHHMLLGLSKINIEDDKEFRVYDFDKEYFILKTKIKATFKYLENSKIEILFEENNNNKNKKIVSTLEKVSLNDFTQIEIRNVRSHKNIIQGIEVLITYKKNEVDRKIEMKMSKSKPDTAIFMTDSKEEILRKFKKAHSIDGVIEDNPILEYFKYIIFEKYSEVEILRDDKFGGLYKCNSYEKLEEDFKNGVIKSIDLKLMCFNYINKLIEPTRKYFEENSEAKDLLEKVKSYQITR